MRRRMIVFAAAAAAALAALVLPPAVGVAHAAGPAAYVQSAAFTTPGRLSSTTVALTGAVGAGDLLLGWFAQYNAAGQVAVSDNVNGAWTRAPSATAFQNDTGDIALYYRANAKAAAGLTITVSAQAAAYYQGAVAEYSGVAISGPLDQIVSNRGVGTQVDTGATPAVPAGELLFSALVTGGNPSSTAPGSGFVGRAHTGTGSAFDEDVLSTAAGSPHGTATLGSSTDWYAVAATFRPTTTGDTQPPTIPTGLHTTSVAAGSVSLAWSPSTDNVAVTGYTVYRNGAALAATAPSTTTYTDNSVSPNTTYSYAVDAFDGAGNHSAQSTAVPVTTLAASPAFVQGAADSPGTRTTTATIAFGGPVTQGHLLVGWFAQYDAPGQVQVTDNVNGAWTRSTSEHFTNGGGDIALFYLQNSKAAPNGLTITLSASAATYLPSAAAEFSGVATSGALDATAVGEGVGKAASSGPTASVAGGELVIGTLITGGQPLTVTPGQSSGAPLQLLSHNGSQSADLAAVLSANSGQQAAPFTLASSMDWYAAAATFRPGP